MNSSIPVRTSALRLAYDPDATRPSFAGATSITAPSSQTSLQLNWTNATDNVGVDHYNIYMTTTSGQEDLTAPFQVTTSGTPVTVTGLVANTTYFFIVRAVDAPGNSDLNVAEVSAATLP